MTDRKRGVRVEVSSEQLHNELEEIKERVGALETVAGIVHRSEIASFVESMLHKKPIRKQIMALCSSAKTREELMASLDLKSRQAIDFHLNPLRENGLLHIQNSSGKQQFVHSPLVRRLTKAQRKAIFDDPGSADS